MLEPVPKGDRRDPGRRPAGPLRFRCLRRPSRVLPRLGRYAAAAGRRRGVPDPSLAPGVLARRARADRRRSIAVLEARIVAIPLASRRTCRVVRTGHDVKLPNAVTLTDEDRLLDPLNRENVAAFSMLARILAARQPDTAAVRGPRGTAHARARRGDERAVHGAREARGAMRERRRDRPHDPRAEVRLGAEPGRPPAHPRTRRRPYLPLPDCRGAPGPRARRSCAPPFGWPAAAQIGNPADLSSPTSPPWCRVHAATSSASTACSPRTHATAASSSPRHRAHRGAMAQPNRSRLACEPR